MCTGQPVTSASNGVVQMCDCKVNNSQSNMVMKHVTQDRTVKGAEGRGQETHSSRELGGGGATNKMYYKLQTRNSM